MKISFQGSLGAHSHMACMHLYPDATYIPCETFEEAINSAEQGEVDYAVIPIENSYAGKVVEMIHILPKISLYIIGEYFHRVEHQLLGLPNTKITDIKEAYSQMQGILQCSNSLSEYDIEGRLFSDTAKSAKYVANLGDKTKGAIASRLAGEIYGLETIKANFNDASDNKTLFLIFAREPYEKQDEDELITSMLFSVRNISAGLYKALGGFATNNVNLLKIESYLAGDNAEFFVTFEGSIENENVQMALEELGFFSKRTKLLGSYKADR